MKIGIIVAMRKEFDLLKPLVHKAESKTIDGKTLLSGTLGSHQVTVMQCGIGKVNAALGTSLLIHRFGPQLVINTGVAGAASPAVSVMDVVVGKQVAYHDVWCGPESTYGAVQGLPLYYGGDAAVLKLLPHTAHVHHGLIVSGDQFVDTREQIDHIREHFPQALAVDMESGAIAQTCRLLQTRFVSLRVISDSPIARHDNTSQYRDFWTDAPQHTFAMVRQLLQQL